jgi:hypothetical protein
MSTVAILNAVGVLAMLVAAISLDVAPVVPVYFYPTSLPMSAPKRVPWLPLWSVLLLILFVSILMTLAVWDRNALPLGPVLRLLVLLSGVVSSSSLICSGFHLLLGTPRPDSAAQCSTSNVTFTHCCEVLSRADAIRQFQSFPAIEAAILVSAAVMLFIIGDVLVPHSNLIASILKFLPTAAAVLVAAYLIAAGAYRVMDIVAGAVTGFLCAYVAANSILIAGIKRQLLPTRRGDAVPVYTSIAEANR